MHGDNIAKKMWRFS